MIENLPDAMQCEIDNLNDGLSTYEQILKRKYAGDMESWGEEIKRQRATIKSLNDEMKVIKKVQREQVQVGLQSQASENILMKKIRYLETQIFDKLKDFAKIGVIKQLSVGDSMLTAE